MITWLSCSITLRIDEYPCNPKANNLFKRRHSRLSELRSKAKRLNLHSVLTILHYPSGHALAITQITFLSEWHLGHLSQ